MDVVTISLLGGHGFGNMTTTETQFKALTRYYGHDPEYAARISQETRDLSYANHQTALAKWEEASPGARERRKPKWVEPDIEGVAQFVQAGGDRGLLREARLDGLRLMAFLAKYLEDTEDPVQFVESLICQAGFDCPLQEWGGDEEEEQ